MQVERKEEQGSPAKFVRHHDVHYAQTRAIMALPEPTFQQCYRTVLERLQSIDTGVMLVAFLTLFGNCTQNCQIKRVEERLDQIHRTLPETPSMPGMAPLPTGVAGMP